MIRQLRAYCDVARQRRRVASRSATSGQAGSATSQVPPLPCVLRRPLSGTSNTVSRAGPDGNTDWCPQLRDSPCAGANAVGMTRTVDWMAERCSGAIDALVGYFAVSAATRALAGGWSLVTGLLVVGLTGIAAMTLSAAQAKRTVLLSGRSITG
jgi:hypothetical protein